MPMLLFAMVLACGQYIPADQAASGTSVIPAEVVLPDASDMSQSTRLQHYGYSSLLSTHTIDVDWRGGTSVALEWDTLQQSLEAQATLGHSLALLASVDPVTLENRNEKLAYWLNLYTGWVVQAVLLARAEDPGFESVSNNNFSLFDTALIRLGDQYWTLNQVESGVIRGALEDHEQLFAGQPTLAALAADWHSDLWQDGPIDARIHMGLHCASRSCPDIPSMAWRGVDLDETLDLASQRFVDHAGKGAGVDGISQIFRWYEADFIQSHGSIESFIEQHRTDGTAGVALDSTLPYDWALNDH